MYYEINVSLNGRHFFATSDRSITDMGKLKKVYEAISEAFTKDKGYEISVTRCSNVGEWVTDEEIKG